MADLIIATREETKCRNVYTNLQPRSQGPLSTSRKYFLEAERGPWERG